MAVQPREFRRLRLLGGVLIGVLLTWFLVDQEFMASLRLRTVEATYGSVEARYRARAVLIRQERVVDSPATGRVTLLVNEGRHVRVGDPVIEVVDEGTQETVAAELARLDERARAVEANYQSELKSLEARTAVLREQLSRAEEGLAAALAQGESERAAQSSAARSELDRQLRELAREAEELARVRDRALAEIEEQKRAWRSVRPAPVSILRAPVAGVVSFGLDGLERELSTSKPLEEVLRAKGSESRVHDGGSVRLGDPLFRIVDPAGAVHAALEVRGSVSLEVGEQVFLAFDHIPERTFPGRLVEAVQVGQTWRGLVSLSAVDVSLAARREGNATILARRAEGIVVPRSALVERNGELGVYVLLGRQPVFRRVRVLGGNEERVAVDSAQGVPVGAAVVRNPGVLR